MSWNDKEERHFAFDLSNVVDDYTLNDAIAMGLGYPRSDDSTRRALMDHLVYQECVYHYHFSGWTEYQSRFPRKSKRFIESLKDYATRHPHAFILHLH